MFDRFFGVFGVRFVESKDSLSLRLGNSCVLEVRVGFRLKEEFRGINRMDFL